jgi:hypothetical protein
VLGLEFAERQFGHGAWPTEKEPLRIRATGRPYENKLIFGFNPLGDGRDPQASSKICHR